MATGVTSGTVAIVLRVQEILKDHLAAEVATVATDAGLTVTAPDTAHGYSLSNFLPRDHASAIRVTIDSSETLDERRVINCNKRMKVRCRVSFELADKIPYDAEVGLQVLSTAAQRVVLQYIFADATHDASVYDATVASVDRGSSVRIRYGSRGMTTTGRGMESTRESLDIVFLFHQHQAQTVTFTDA